MMNYRALILCSFLFSVLACCLPMSAFGERPHIDTDSSQVDPGDGGSLADMELTPQMWLYSQERQRYEDPKAAVRRKAEARAWQRQQRIALMKAFGLSKQRPLVYSTPFQSYYSPWNQYGYLTVPVVVVPQP